MRAKTAVIAALMSKGIDMLKTRGRRNLLTVARERLQLRRGMSVIRLVGSEGEI